MIPACKSPFLERWFLLYTRRYLAQNFHAVRLLGSLPAFPPDDGLPLLVCLNHSSWWDVMLGIYAANDLFPWDTYAVMDERQLKRYRFFARVGIIGVDRTSLAGARAFLEYAGALLKNHRRALWITAQGEMVSNRTRPMQFQSGVGHIAASVGEFYFTTVALHYEFWNERLPEAFLSASPIERVSAGDGAFDRKKFVTLQERRMEAQLDALIAQVDLRDETAFQTLLSGKSGISPTYDAVRALSARLKGERFSAEHGDVVTPRWGRGPRK